MNPAHLSEGDLSTLPPDSRRLAAANLDLLREMPFSLAPSFLREILAYAWQFPAEQKEFEARLAWLSKIAPEQRARLFAPFAQLTIPDRFRGRQWVADPVGFAPEFSAYLWQSGQIDAYHRAAQALMIAMPEAQSAKVPSLVMVVIGRQAGNVSYPLFRRLRSAGLHAVNVDPEGCPQAILEALAERARRQPVPYAHWYIDGGSPWPLPARAQGAVGAVSYPQLDPVRTAVLGVMAGALQEAAGPEHLQLQLARLDPQTAGAGRVTTDAKLQHFYLSLFTEGAGTQIFSTSFAQWAGQQVLRHARPLTLCLRFAPRQRQTSLNSLIGGKQSSAALDPNGSLIDADMASYYLYLELRRLTGTQWPSCIVWFEGNRQVLAAGPTIPRGTESASPLGMERLIEWVLET